MVKKAKLYELDDDLFVSHDEDLEWKDPLVDIYIDRIQSQMKLEEKINRMILRHRASIEKIDNANKTTV